MPTPKEQISTTVEAMVAAGRIQPQMREEYMKLLAANDDLASDFAGMFMRHNDYTRKTQELAEQRRQQEAAIAAERQRVASEQAALKQWEQEARAEMDRLKQQANQTPELMARVAAYETALEAYGLKDKVTVPTFAPAQPQGVPPMTAPAAPTGPLPYLTRDEGVGAIRELTSLYSQAMLIAGEHQRLFGQPLTEDLINESLNTGRPIRELWEAKHNVAAKRSEIEARDRQQWEEKLRQEGYEKARAELISDPSRITHPAAAGLPGPSKGGVLDVLASRALAGEASGQQAPPVPERIPEGQGHMNRVQAAMAEYYKQFNPDGSPRQAGTTAQGF